MKPRIVFHRETITEFSERRKFMRKVIVASLILLVSFSVAMAACAKDNGPVTNDVQFAGTKDFKCYVDDSVNLTEGVSVTNNGAAISLADIYVIDKDGVPCDVTDEENFSLSVAGEYIVTYVAKVGETEFTEDVSMTVAEKDVIVNKSGTNPTMVYLGDSVTFAEVSAVVSAIDDTPVAVKRTVSFNDEDLNITEDTFTPSEKGEYTVTYYAENKFGADYSVTLTDKFIVAAPAPENLLNGFEDSILGISEEDAKGTKFTVNEDLEYVASGIKSLKIATAEKDGSPVFECNSVLGTSDLSNWSSISFDVKTEPGVEKYIGFSYVFFDTWQTVTFGVTATNEWKTCTLDLTGLPAESLKNVWAFRIYVVDNSVYYLDNFVFETKEGGGDVDEEPENLLQGFENGLPEGGFVNDGLDCTFTLNEDAINAASGTKSLKIESVSDGNFYIDCAAAFGSSDLSDYSSISMKVKGTGFIGFSYIFYNNTWNQVDVGTPATSSWVTLTLDLSGIDQAYLENVWAIRIYVAPNCTFYIDDITFA